MYVPTLNSERTLANCLESIRKSTDAPICIVDKFSKDRTVDIANSFGCRISQANLNLGQARSWAIEDCSTRFLLLVDSDTYLNSNWIPEAMKWWKDLSASDPLIASVQGLNYQIYEPYKRYILWTYSKRQYPFKNPYRLDTASILIEKEKARGFKTDAPVLEDYLLGKYLYSRGYNVYVVPIFSPHDKPPEMIRNDYFWGGSGFAQYGDKPLWKFVGALLYVPARVPLKMKLVAFKTQWWTLQGYLSKNLERRHTAT